MMSFTVTDEPVYIDLTLSENKEEVSGSFFFFANLFLDFTNTLFKLGFCQCDPTVVHPSKGIDSSG